MTAHSIVTPYQVGDFVNAKKICTDHKFKESIKKSHTVRRSNLSTRRKNDVSLKEIN